MANATFTTAQPTNVRGYAVANRKVRFFTLTSDTNNYRTGGTTVTAASLGMKRFDFVTQSGGVATSGSAGATGLPVGIRYGTDDASVTIQLYEGSAAGTILAEKTDDEAMPSNFTMRFRAEGY